MSVGSNAEAHLDITFNDISLGDFVLVEFCAGRHPRYFIGQIPEKIDGIDNVEKEISYLRKLKRDRGVVSFHFPLIRDVQVSPFRGGEGKIIKKVVGEPQRRGGFCFQLHEDLMKYVE